MGVTAIGPVIEKTRASAVTSEGQIIIDAAQLAYTANLIDEENKIVSGECYSITSDQIKNYYTQKDSKFSGYFKLTDENGNIKVEYVLVNTGTGYGTYNESKELTAFNHNSTKGIKGEGTLSAITDEEANAALDCSNIS